MGPVKGEHNFSKVNRLEESQIEKLSVTTPMLDLRCCSLYWGLKGCPLWPITTAGEYMQTLRREVDEVDLLSDSIIITLMNHFRSLKLFPSC